MAAVRWTRRPAVAVAGGPSTGVAPELQSRLDDELRDLD
jgi:hypothetical protein